MTPMKFGEKSRELISYRYIGHSELYNSYYGMLCVWYIPGRQQV